MKTLREIVIEWWSKIPTLEREQLWIAQPVVLSTGRFASSAIIREIEQIFLYFRENKTEYCFKFDKTVDAVNCIELLNGIFNTSWSGGSGGYYSLNGSHHIIKSPTCKEISPTLFYAILKAKITPIPPSTNEWIQVVDNKINKEHEGVPIWVYHLNGDIRLIKNSSGLILSNDYTHYMPAQLPPPPPTIKEQICDMIANNKGNLEELADNIIKMFK